MAKETYTQREFSELTGLSTATIVKMLKLGNIKRAADGKIPASEVEKAMKEKLKKYANKGTLILIFEDSPFPKDALINAVIEDLKSAQTDVDEEDRVTPICISSINDIIEKATEGDSKLPTEELIRIYNRRVLKEFMIEYDSMIKDFIHNIAGKTLAHESKEKEKRERIADTYREIREELPYEALLDLMYYEKVIYFKDNPRQQEVVNNILNSCADDIKRLQMILDAKFDLIMRKLFLVQGDPYMDVANATPLFTRSMLSPDFFECRGSLYNSFFKDSTDSCKPVVLRQVPKIAESMKTTLATRRRKANLDTLLKAGYYSIITLNSTNLTSEFEDALIMNICSGLYNKIVVNLTADDFKSRASARLTMGLDIASSTNNIAKYFI